MAFFIKAEFLSDLSPKQLASFDVDSITYRLDLKDMFIGKITGDILKEETKPQHFLIKVNKSFRQAARHLLHTFPLDNPLLVSLSALYPSAPNHSVVGKCLKILSGHFKHYLSALEEEQILIEIKNYTVAPNNYSGVDIWWAQQNTLPTLQKLARACLTIFHGPQVEGSFSKMKDTMKTKSANLAITTFSALQTIKYALKARNSNAIDCFNRKDILHQEVDAHLVQAIRGSAGKYKKTS